VVSLQVAWRRDNASAAVRHFVDAARTVATTL
jgi:hypothetical protein